MTTHGGVWPVNLEPRLWQTDGNSYCRLQQQQNRLLIVQFILLFLLCHDRRESGNVLLTFFGAGSKICKYIYKA